jgi:hypothetical protein
VSVDVTVLADLSESGLIALMVLRSPRLKFFLSIVLLMSMLF